jgi:peroxiredoxin
MTLEQILAPVAASDLPLQHRLDALKAEFESHIAPPAIVAALHRATDELIASGAAARALKAGDVAPLFVLPDPEKKLVSAEDLLILGPLVVTFYRGVWCPYCNFDLQALEAARPQIETRGARLVAISPQTAPNSRKSQRQNQLGFPILSDKGGTIAARFGVHWTVPEHLRSIHKQLGGDLTQFNGEGSWTLPLPARYVVGQSGIIAYAEVNPDYTRRPEPSDVFPVLDALRAQSAAHAI